MTHDFKTLFAYNGLRFDCPELSRMRVDFGDALIRQACDELQCSPMDSACLRERLEEMEAVLQ